MSLEPGTRPGVFEIPGLLEKGGTGEEYRAKDTKPVREVAIKVLAEGFAEDRERLARFEHEARLLVYRLSSESVLESRTRQGSQTRSALK